MPHFILERPHLVVWLGVQRGTGGAKPAFFEEMLQLFRQFRGEGEPQRPTRALVEAWMGRYPSGLDPRIVKLRDENRDRILEVLIDHMERGEIKSARFRFEPGSSRVEKLRVARGWWNDHLFHLGFAVRSPELLNEMLGHSLSIR